MGRMNTATTTTFRPQRWLAILGAASLLGLAAHPAAHAETYRLTGQLTHYDYHSHGATGDFDLLVETAGPATTAGVPATAISGT